MLVEKITSRQNPLVKRFRRVRAGGESHLIFIEGVRLVEDALKTGVHFETIAFTSEMETTPRGMSLRDALQTVHCRGAHVTRQIMEALTETQNPQGIAALVGRPYFDLEEVFDSTPQLIVIADRLQDPGNLGSIIRTAEAAQATALITTADTVDPYNHKALRAAMGSALRLPIATHAKQADIIALCRERQIKMIASYPDASRPEGVLEDAALAKPIRIYAEAELTSPLALILGREASGVSDDLSSHADEFLHIPMAESVESLNVAAAAAILLYEAARQRRFAALNA